MNYSPMTGPLVNHAIVRKLVRFDRVVMAALAAVVAVVVVPMVGTPVRAETARVVGTLPRFPADAADALGKRILPTATESRPVSSGTLVAIPSANQLWQLFATNSGYTGPTAVAVRDFDTLKIVKAFDIPVPLHRLIADLGGDWLHAIDGANRIFFLDKSRSRLVEVDVRTFTTKVHDLPPPFTAVPGTVAGLLSPASMDYDPFSDSILMMYGGPPNLSAAQVSTVLMKFDLKTKQPDQRPVRVCNGQLTPVDQGLTSQFESIIRRDYAYFVCQRVGSIGAVVRIAYDDLFAKAPTDELIVAGPAYLDTALADPDSGRIFLMTAAGEVWAFSVEHMAFVGVISARAEGRAEPRVGYGVDRSTGRVFFMSSTYGLGVAEGRFFPIPQARTYPDRAAPGQERLISDGDNGRLFVMTGAGGTRANEWTIYDVGKAPKPPAPPDPDSNTTDADEQSDVNQSRYFGSGTGYGARVLLAKGISAVPPAPALGQVAPTADLIANRVNSKCGFSDRELIAGHVAKAEYETGSTAARAVGIDVDERTKLDLAHLSRCDVVVRDAQAVFQGVFATVPRDFKEETPDYDQAYVWPRVPAECNSFEGGEPMEGSSTHDEPSSGNVECPLPGGRLDAHATGYLSGPVAVGRSSTVSTIHRDKRGVVAQVVSEAHDINIADVVHIGEVTSRAMSIANGRPRKGDMSTYSVTVKGVRVVVPDDVGQANGRDNDIVICENVCDAAETTRRLNLLMGGRVEFKTSSGLDSALQRGTPRGAQTAVQKSSAKQASDQALVGDRSTEVAALEMVVYNDNQPFGRARQIYQFAGVATAATYNIVRLPFGAGFDDPSGDDGGFDAAALEPGGVEGEFLLPGVSDLPGASAFAGGDAGGGDSIAAAVLRAIGRGIRMFFTDPRQAMLLLTAWALFSLPAVLTRRRRQLAAIRAE